VADYNFYAYTTSNVYSGITKEEYTDTPPDLDAWWTEMVETASSTMQTGLVYTGVSSFYIFTDRTPPLKDEYSLNMARTFLKFDTSSIPDGETIETARLYLYLYSKSVNSPSPTMILQNGIGCHFPFQATDFNEDNHDGNYGEKAFSALPAAGQWFYIEINDVSIINKTGNTFLVLKTNLDLNHTRPTLNGKNFAILSYRPTFNPRLYITTAVVPTVTTNTATEISYDCAMGNGEITSGINATERGFEIVLNFSGTLYDAIDHSIAGFEGDVNYSLDSDSWVGTLTKTETETGSFAEGEYSLVLGWETVLGNPGAVFSDKLFKCESYTYRAYAVIDGETYYGEYVAFSTLCDSGGEQQPNDDISDGDPTQPIIPEEEEPLPPFEPEEPEEIPYPPWEWDLPEWDIPDYPPPTFVGDFYYKKPYTKKDIDELRQKCIIYNKNSIEFALVLRHNINVLREFLNMMTDYLGTDEFNDFTDLVPPQNLKELYLDPIEPEGFRTIINGFINNTVNNNMAVNRNFKLIADGLSDYETSEDASFRDITSAIKRIDEDNPDVHRMKQIIDDLNYEVASNFGNVMYNLEVVRARLL